MKEHDQAFADLAGSIMIFASVGRGSDATRSVAELVTGDYFQALGVGAQLGRTLQPSDDVAPGQHPVAVIGDGLWRRTYGADPNVIGKTLYLNGQPLTIVGVADPEFRGTVVSMVVDVFVPIMMQPRGLPSRPPRSAQRDDDDDGRPLEAGRDHHGSGGANARPRGAARRERTDSQLRQSRDGDSDLAVAVRRADLLAAGDRRARRDGPADPAGGVRERRQSRAGARRQPPR